MIAVEMDYNDLETFFRIQTEVKLSFTKKDGTIREMKCTRKDFLIPDDHKPKGESDREVNKEVFPVYDLENEGWRSFRVDSLLSIG